MAAIGQVQHTRTGFQAIDCVAYRHAPAALSLATAPRDILLYRIVDYGPARVTGAERPADERELLLLTRGSGRPAHARIAGEPYTITPNRDLRASFVPSGADSQIEFGSSAKSVNLVVPKGLLNTLLEDRGGKGAPPLLFSDNRALIGLISRIELELFRPGLASDIVTEQALRAIALILSGIDPHGFMAQSARISLSPLRLKRVIDFVEANLAEPLTLDMLAEVAGLSVFHFARVFRQTTGFSPYRYVSEQRLLTAQRMLMQRECPISAIAAACSYPRHANFSAAFARARGLSPSAYRKRFAL